MSIEKLRGKVQTVLGTLDSSELGITLTHEHLFCDLSSRFTEPALQSEKLLAYEPIKIENLGWIRYNISNCLDGLKMWDEPLAVSELLYFKSAGGKTLIDMTGEPGRDPLALARISRATEVNIIMGGGYYLGKSHPSELKSKDVDKIAEELIRDITDGVGNTGIKSGMLGEIGLSYPATEEENKVLRAVGMAQKATGAPVCIHPGLSIRSPFEHLQLLKESGGDISHTVIAHVDNRFGNDVETAIKLADTGCYLEYDIFGHLEQHPLPLPTKTIYMLSDWQRVECIKQLIDRGYIKQILMSQDVCRKILLKKYGGYGYSHILNNIVPLMRLQGVSDDQIQTILVHNPGRMAQFV